MFLTQMQSSCSIKPWSYDTMLTFHHQWKTKISPLHRHLTSFKYAYLNICTCTVKLTHWILSIRATNNLWTSNTINNPYVAPFLNSVYKVLWLTYNHLFIGERCNFSWVNNQVRQRNEPQLSLGQPECLDALLISTLYIWNLITPLSFS